MNVHHYQLLKGCWFIFAVITLLILSPDTIIAQAQAPSPFEISVIPAAEHAVSGETFTYTVVVTNISQAPLQNAFINVEVPKGTKFLHTRYSNAKWYGGNSFADPDTPVEQVRLFTPEEVEADETFIFEMVVEIIPEAAQEIAVDSYNVTVMDSDTFASGPAIITEVLDPTATLTSTPLPSPSPTRTATPEPRNEPSPTPQAIVSVNTSTPIPIAEAEIKPTNPTTPNDTTGTGERSIIERISSNIILIGSIIGLILIGLFITLLGTIRFLKK